MLPEYSYLPPDQAPVPGYTPLSWWETWVKALTQPRVEAYEQIANDPDASLMRASMWIFLSTLVAMFIAIPISVLLNPQVFDALPGGAGGVGQGQEFARHPAGVVHDIQRAQVAAEMQVPAPRRLAVGIGDVEVEQMFTGAADAEGDVGLFDVHVEGIEQQAQVGGADIL